MDDFLKLGDNRPKKRCRKATPAPHPEITPERIEKLKKTFQPYWMRGMILHRDAGDDAPAAIDTFSNT